jgi:DNA-binding transcriptional regulator YhcF (GntR family)
MIEKQRPGVKKALEFLATIRAKKSSATLPPIRALAKASDVSFVTMWKAFNLFTQNGFIVPAPKSNKFIFSFDDTPVEEHVQPSDLSDCSTDNSHISSRQSTTDRIYKDIISGRFATHEKLPSCKEMQLLYDVSFSTLKKSLTDLVQEQIIEFRTNGYYLPSLTGNTGHSRIVVISYGMEDGKLWVDHQDKNYFRVIESECIRMNIQLDVIVHHSKNNRLHFIHSASTKEYNLEDQSILGYIFIVANIDSSPELVLDRLVRLKRNIAVLDVVGGWRIPQCARNNRYVRYFTTTASELPAKRVAQYLLSKGHNRIAFMSPFHRSLWSKRRLSTLDTMYSRCGPQHSVVPFVLEDYAYQWDFLDKQDNDSDLKTLISEYSQLKKDENSKLFRRFGNLGLNLLKYITDINCGSAEIYEKMHPLFTSALSDKSITAWVMANDFAATMAIDFLKERQIHIPGDLAIISFDNTIDAMEYQLTSWDFNTFGIVNMLLRYILAPHTVKAKPGNDFLEVDGALVIRRSC